MVDLWFVKLSDPLRSIRKLIEPVELIGKDKYLTYVSWFDSSTVIVIWTLRSQNYSILINCSGYDNWSCRRSNVISESINKVKYLGSSILTRENPSKHFIITPKPDLKIGQYNHIAHFNPQVSWTYKHVPV